MKPPTLIATVAFCCLGLSLTACGSATPARPGPMPPTAVRPSGASSPGPVGDTATPASEPTLATDVRLGDADNRTSVSVTVGDTIGLRLHDGTGGLGSLGWINPSVLSTTGVFRDGDHDLTALFRATGEGQDAITIFRPCRGTECAAVLRYQVTVVVTRPH